MMSKLRTRSFVRLTVAALLLCTSHWLRGQDLSPRAYLITPVDGNAVTTTYSFYDGSLNFNGALPITDATGIYSVPIFSYYHSFGIFGRSANILAALPYGIGNFQGLQGGIEEHVYRSGLADSAYRFSVNLKGGPAMAPREFLKWHQKILLGAGLKVIAPTGQYDPTKLVNWSTHRWAFKPEFGYSQRFGHWILDGYAGVWFFTTNHEFYPGTVTNTQTPMGSVETHLSYSFTPRLWASADGNFWFGGTSVLNGSQNSLTKQENSRIGATVAFPISRHQSLKFAYSNGTYVRFGGNYQNVSVAWQYSWIRHP